MSRNFELSNLKINIIKMLFRKIQINKIKVKLSII